LHGLDAQDISSFLFNIIMHRKSFSELPIIGNQDTIIDYTVPATSFAASVAGSLVLPAASSAHLSNFSMVAL